MTLPPLIHVVDDDESLRTALSRLLQASGYEVELYSSTGDFLMRSHPDRQGCVLLDVRMPGPSGLDLQDAMSRLGIPLPIVFMTAHADVPSSVRAMKGGAVDFLTKPIEREALFDALARALERDAVQRAARGEAEALLARVATLTAGERQVFELVVQGKLNKQIAGDLAISERTVKLYRANAMQKLGVGSAAELGRIAERLQKMSR